MAENVCILLHFVTVPAKQCVDFSLHVQTFASGSLVISASAEHISVLLTIVVSIMQVLRVKIAVHFGIRIAPIKFKPVLVPFGNGNS